METVVTNQMRYPGICLYVLMKVTKIPKYGYYVLWPRSEPDTFRNTTEEFNLLGTTE